MKHGQVFRTPLLSPGITVRKPTHDYLFQVEFLLPCTPLTRAKSIADFVQGAVEFVKSQGQKVRSAHVETVEQAGGR